MQNNNDNQVNQPQKGLQLDLSNTLMKEDSLTFLRNGVLTNFDGDFIHAITEQSNRLVCTLPYPIIGCQNLPDGTWALFLTDNVDSEIGIFNETTFEYNTKLNAKWLNFNQSSLISSASKENQDGSYSLYFSDGRRNPDRIVNLSKVDKATYDSVRMAKLITPPRVEIFQSNSGVLQNGSYQAVIRYSQNSIGFGSYYSLTLPETVWTELDNSGAVDVSISSIDSDFEFFELVVLQSRKGVTTAKLIGTYPRATSKVHISNFEDPRYIKVDLSEITTEHQPYFASDQISSNDEYLFRVGVETIPELNYQLQAFDIEQEYVAHEYPENYHSYGKEVSNYRDEVMAYSIQWLHKTGAWSSGFTIAGREAEAWELEIDTSADAYEALVKKCDEDTVPVFLVKNTAQKMVLSNTEETICEGREVGYGKMAYYQSTDNYPDNKFQYGKWANTPIRHPKFPDEEKCPRYTIRNGKAYINLLGIRFKNIPHPKKSDGTLDEDWIGYRIIRANRAGNKSVISRVLLTNMRGYNEIVGNQQKEVMYSNYPVNDLRPDSFISQTQTINKGNKELNFNPLSKVYFDKFSAHSPHFSFRRDGLGEELKVETEEVADVVGHFRKVWNHPKGKLLSLFSFWIAATLGILESFLVTTGKTVLSQTSELSAQALNTGPSNSLTDTTEIRTVEDIIGLDPIKMIADAAKSFKTDLSLIKKIRLIALSVASVGLKVLTFTFFAIQYADQVLDVIYKFLGYTDYALQYNGHAYFNKQVPVSEGNKRRFINHYQYLQSGLGSANGKPYNNFRKNPSVYVELDRELGKYTNEDNTRKTIGEAGVSDDVFRDFTSQGVAYYATNKRKILNQYGRIESIINFVITHNSYFPVTPSKEGYSTPTIFGGDCYIVKDSVQIKHHFFTQDQSYPLSTDGEEFNYLHYRNVGYPRFWANFFKYDFSELISKNIVNFATLSRTVTNRHNLDNKGKDEENKFRVDNAYFYTSSNAVLQYFVESDINTYFRGKPDNDTYFLSDSFTSIDEIFRSDRLLKEEQFKYDMSLSKQADQIYALHQPIDYNPDIYDKRIKYSRNRLLYSLPSYEEYKYDNWQYFLNGNQYEFSKAKFGNLTSLHRVDNSRIMFLFDRASPYVTVGRNQLQLKDGTEIELGSGGLFAQPPAELIYTEQHYGNAQSKHGSASTPYGTFYVSERQGRFFKYSGNLEEITRNGIHTWSKNYFPVKLIQSFPDFIDSDNPVVGVGYLISVDTEQDIIYISKKDYLPKNKDITYDKNSNQFYHNSNVISLLDDNYFFNLSFTLSLSPTVNSFVSFHDWIPDWVIPTEKNFITAKGNTLWKHNDNPHSYCNYYGKQNSFELAYIQNNKFQEETLSSIEYYLECWKYAEDAINKFQLFNENFSHVIISNTEQISGLISLLPESGNPFVDILYPKINNLGFDTLYSKVENKYRIDQFWDITKNRKSDMNLIQYLPDGYRSSINPAAIDVNKSVFERKLFRSQFNKIHFIKDNPISKMIFKLALSKSIKSPR